MVYLLGGHTVGVAHCSLFEDRLYNFQNSGKPDPIMNLVLLEILKSRCPQNATVDNTADLDENPGLTLSSKSEVKQTSVNVNLLNSKVDLLDIKANALLNDRYIGNGI
ncbi:unnamed protein product [Camellia sinensis]